MAGETGQGPSIIPDGAKPEGPAAPLAKPRRPRAPRASRVPPKQVEPAAPLVVSEQVQDESLKIVDEALKREYTNLTDWHECLMESNRDVLTKGGVLSVRANGHVVNYEVTVERVKPNEREKWIRDYGNLPVDSISLYTKDRKRGQQPRNLTLVYKEGRLGQADGLLIVETVWDNEDGLVGESIMCDEGRINYIFKAGKNNVYVYNPDYDNIPNGHPFEPHIRKRLSQNMAVQFVHDDKGNLTHHYDQLGNWDRPLFWYVDGKAWDKKTIIPDFLLKSGARVIDRSYEEEEKLKGKPFEHTFSTTGASEDFVNPHGKFADPVNITTEDGQKFTHSVAYGGGDTLNHGHYREFEGTIKVPLTFDVLPQIQKTFPGSVEGVAPLLSGKLKRKLRLQIESPSSPAQRMLIRTIQEMSENEAKWTGVTTDELKEAHTILQKPEVLAMVFDGLSDELHLYERVADYVHKEVPFPGPRDAAIRGLKPLFTSEVFYALDRAKRLAGLSQDDLRWALSAIFKGQTDLIDGSDPEVGRLDRVRAQLATIRSRIPKLSFGRRRR